VLGGELPDVGVHAVLDLKHVDGAPPLLQALEETPLKEQVLATLRQDGGWKLLGVSHQYHPGIKMYSVSFYVYLSAQSVVPVLFRMRSITFLIAFHMTRSVLSSGLVDYFKSLDF
jgi:hypothetical protein